MKRAALILAPAFVIFFALWIAHLNILAYSGQGDNFMNQEFRATCVPAAEQRLLLNQSSCGF